MKSEHGLNAVRDGQKTHYNAQEYYTSPNFTNTVTRSYQYHGQTPENDQMNTLNQPFGAGGHFHPYPSSNADQQFLASSKEHRNLAPYNSINGRINQTSLPSLFSQHNDHPGMVQFSAPAPATSYERTHRGPPLSSSPLATPNSFDSPVYHRPYHGRHNTTYGTQTIAPALKARRNTAPEANNLSFQPNDPLPSIETLPSRRPLLGNADHIVYGVGQPTPIISGEDKPYVDYLMRAMMDTSEAQDNAGMITTWQRMVETKKEKMQSACQRMLVRLLCCLHGSNSC